MSSPYDAPQRYRVVWNQTAGQYATKATVAYTFARSLHEAQQLAEAQFQHVVNVRLEPEAR